MTRRDRGEPKRKCGGSMKWHDDGNAFMCERCGHVVRRTRADPMPDTTHERRVRARRKVQP